MAFYITLGLIHFTISYTWVIRLKVTYSQKYLPFWFQQPILPYISCKTIIFEFLTNGKDSEKAGVLNLQTIWLLNIFQLKTKILIEIKLPLPSHSRSASPLQGIKLGSLDFESNVLTTDIQQLAFQ